MNRSIEYGLSILGASVALGLGVTACGSEKQADTANCKAIDGADNVRIVGYERSGAYSAVNDGECITMFNPKTLRSVGTLAHNGSFTVNCLDGPKPAAFNIETPNGLKGNVDLGSHVVAELHGKDFFKGTDFQGVHIPACTY